MGGYLLYGNKKEVKILFFIIKYNILAQNPYIATKNNQKLILFISRLEDLYPPPQTAFFAIVCY